MNSPSDDVLIHGYLDRLSRAAATLPQENREELLSSINEHIEAAREAEPANGLVVRRTLDRLGPPEEVAAAAGARPHRPASTTSELIAVLLLTLGSLVVPFVGWIVGVVLLWTSPLWKRREKALGTLVWPGGYFGVILLLTLPGGSQTCSGGEQMASDGTVTRIAETCTGEGFALPPWLGVPAAVLFLVLPAVVAVVLFRRASQRATTSTRGWTG